jgi:hypothetical protein
MADTDIDFDLLVKAGAPVLHFKANDVIFREDDPAAELLAAPNRPRCANHPSRNGSLAPSPAFCDRKFEIVTPTSRMPLGGGKTDRIRPRATSCSLSLVSMLVSIDRLRVDI